jgi:hypothetical protein
LQEKRERKIGETVGMYAVRGGGVIGRNKRRKKEIKKGQSLQKQTKA